MKARLDALLGMVSLTLEQLVAATEPELKFHDDVTVLDEQLPAYVVALQEAYAGAQKAVAEGYAYLDAVYATLEAAHDKVKAAYRKALSLPEATTGDEVMCYYLQCLDTEAYVYCFEGADNPGAISAWSLPKDAPVTELAGDTRLPGVTPLSAGNLTAIPYYAWSNRGKHAMSVFAREE